MIMKLLGVVFMSRHGHFKKKDEKSFMTFECKKAREKIGEAREIYLAKNRTMLEKNDFVQPAEKVSDEETKKFKYPFENLVLAGGGIKGISYVGLIKVLEEHGISEQIKRYAGTSSGSLVAALLAVGFNSYDIQEILKVDFKKVVNDVWWMSSIKNLIFGYGLNTGNKFYKFLGDVLRLKTGNPDITFQELYFKTHKELCIVTVNVDTSEEVYCHWTTTPDLPIRLAVRMSMAIPGLFTPVTWSLDKKTTDHFVDGGLYVNYPVHCYDGLGIHWIMDGKKHKPNQKTIGAVVFSELESGLYSEMFQNGIRGYTLPGIPRTTLSGRMDETRYRAEDIKKIWGAVWEFEEFIYRDMDKEITKDEFETAFNDKSFKEKSQKVLFGEGCDADTAFTAVDRMGGGKITYRDFLLFTPSTGAVWFEPFNDYKRFDTTNVRKYFGSMISGLSSYAGKVNFHKRDIDRTIIISSWYIKATDFDLEEDDKQFLIKEGKGSTRQFLEKYVDRHTIHKKHSCRYATLVLEMLKIKGIDVSDKDIDLKQLSEEETEIRDNKVPKCASVENIAWKLGIGNVCDVIDWEHFLLLV